MIGLRVWWLAGMALLVLQGCVQLGAQEDSRSYFLSPKNSFEQLPAQPVSWQLVVEEPTPAGGLDTARIAVHPRPHEIRYFAGARWAARAPAMVQTLVIESFENSERIVGVARPGGALRPDYLLRLELREFQIEYAERQLPRANVVLIAQLLDRRDRRIVGAERFDARVDSLAEGGVAERIPAFDEALGKVLKRLVSWSLRCGNFAIQPANKGLTCPV